MREVKIANLKALDAFVAEFAASLRGGEVVGLIGDLGAGKTTFVQRLAHALGARDVVKSPTFVLMQVYATSFGSKKRGIGRICHVDAYRLKDQYELNTIGFEEYAADPKTVCLVEWADRVPELSFNSNYKEIRFIIGMGGERILRLVK